MNLFEILQSSNKERPLIGGHRGHLSETRENTIANFREVQKNGIRYIEIDVQLSADQTAVIFHDRDLSEKTPLSGTIRDYTVQQLKASFEICTLDEALAWCKENEMPLLLEIKSKGYDDLTERPALARQIVAAIRKNQMEDLCIPFSIDYRILRMIKTALPEVSIAVIAGEYLTDPEALMRDLDASIYLAYLEDMDAELVDKLHQGGYMVDGSVVNSRERLDLACSLHVDLIESDYPERVISMLEESR